MKILVVFTGGTIGSLVHDGFISPDERTRRLLIDLYEKKYGSDIDFEIIEPYYVLSETLSHLELNLLVDCVTKEAKKEYDGIIVTHGTDTLQYSAAALSFALGSETVPVLLVSANYPLTDPRSNGLINFAAAVDFIRLKKGRGVFVSYQNENETASFYHALGLLSHREGDDALFAFDLNKYGTKTEETIFIFDNEKDEREGLGAFSLCEKPEILVVESFPGRRYNFDLSNCNAIILRPYHSGTLNTKDKEFEKLCLLAKEKKIPVFLVNVKAGNAYESEKIFGKLGIKSIYESSFISTYMRLWIGISRGEDLNLIF